MEVYSAVLEVLTLQHKMLVSITFGAVRLTCIANQYCEIISTMIKSMMTLLSFQGLLMLMFYQVVSHVKIFQMPKHGVQMNNLKQMESKVNEVDCGVSLLELLKKLNQNM